MGLKEDGLDIFSFMASGQQTMVEFACKVDIVCSVGILLVVSAEEAVDDAFDHSSGMG